MREVAGREPGRGTSELLPRETPAWDTDNSPLCGQVGEWRKQPLMVREEQEGGVNIWGGEETAATSVSLLPTPTAIGGGKGRGGN